MNGLPHCWPAGILTSPFLSLSGCHLWLLVGVDSNVKAGEWDKQLLCFVMQMTLWWCRLWCKSYQVEGRDNCSTEMSQEATVQSLRLRTSANVKMEGGGLFWDSFGIWWFLISGFDERMTTEKLVRKVWQ